MPSCLWVYSVHFLEALATDSACQLHLLLIFLVSAHISPLKWMKPFPTPVIFFLGRLGTWGGGGEFNEGWKKRTSMFWTRNLVLNKQPGRWMFLPLLFGWDNRDRVLWLARGGNWIRTQVDGIPNSSHSVPWLNWAQEIDHNTLFGPR